MLHTGVNYFYIHQTLNDLSGMGVTITDLTNTINTGSYPTIWTDYASREDINNLASTFLSTTVGASGAIYGILVAFGMFFPDAKLMLFFVPYPIAARYFIPIIVALDLIMGLVGNVTIFGGNIAHFAHVGGALIGFLIMLYWKKNTPNTNQWNRYY